MNLLARRKSTYAARSLMAFSGVLIMAWLLATSSSAVSSVAQGKTIFTILSSLGLCFALFAGVIATADCVSEEKREGTLGLLFLTDLKGYDIVLGKMTATSLSAAFALFGFVPIISLAIFLGGVSLQQVAGAALVLGITMFYSLSVGVVVSSFSTNERKAMFASFVAMGALMFGPYLLGMIFYDLDRIPESITILSPLYSFLCIFVTGGAGVDPSYFWISLLLQFLLSAALLLIAARILPQCVSELPSVRFQWLRNLAHNLSFGDPRKRKKHRAELLDRNAFLWLASRERIKPRYAWAIIALFTAIYGWIYYLFPDMFFELVVSLLVLFLIQLAFKLWTASEVCSRLIEDRRSGALELLLSSPLSVREIAHGQTLALRRIFFRPLVLLFIAELGLLRGALNQPRQMLDDGIVAWCFAAIIASFWVDLWALKWVGMWLSLRGKSIERVLLATVFKVMVLPWLIFVATGGIVFSVRILNGQGQPFGPDILRLWLGISLVTALTFAIPARFRFLRTFREAATQRFDAPPEFKPAPIPKTSAPVVRHARPRRGFARFALPAVLLLLIGGPTLRRYYWQGKVDREIRAISAEGFPASAQAVAQFYNPVPGAENSIAVMQSSGTINLGAFGRRINFNGTFGVTGVTPINAELRENFRKTVVLNTAQLAAFRKAMRLTNAYVQPIVEALWTYPNELNTYAMVAWIEGIVAAENQETDRAVESALNLLRYAERLRKLPAPQAQFVCESAIAKAGQILERLLYRQNLSDDLLAAIQAQIDRVDDEDVLRRSIIVRRALFLTRMRSTLPDPNMPPNTAIAAINGLMSGIGSRDEGYYRFLRSYRFGLEAIKLPPFERREAAAKLDQAGSDGLVNILGYQRSGYELGFMVQSDSTITARLRVLQTVLAAERFRRAKSQLPESLEMLVPTFLSTVPLDPFSGATLKFKPERTQLRIYSVGPDQKDDGGKPADYSRGDFVFSLWSRDAAE